MREDEIEDYGFLDEDVERVETGIDGVDELFAKGIPKGSAVMVSGGTGSGKTILGLQILAGHAFQGDKCLYMSFEESEKSLLRHMQGFGMEPRNLLESGNLVVKRFSPFVLRREIGSELKKERGEMDMDLGSTFLPKSFEPDFIVVDSLSSVLNAFTGEGVEYRRYVEELFRYLESLDCTSFLISETSQDAKRFSPTGVEEFLADGVFVLYNFREGNVRERAFEVLKMRGTEHQRKLVAMSIGDNGVEVFPGQEVFSAVGD